MERDNAGEVPVFFTRYIHNSKKYWPDLRVVVYSPLIASVFVPRINTTAPATTVNPNQLL
jgi:hypothetical protein